MPKLNRCLIQRSNAQRSSGRMASIEGDKLPPTLARGLEAFPRCAHS